MCTHKYIHTESVSFQCFLVCFVQLWGVVTVKKKKIKDLMSSQHHCSKYTKKDGLYEDNGKKPCISFFGLFYVSVHIHSVNNDSFHFCESSKN